MRGVVVVAGVADAYAGKGTEGAVDLIVGVEACLEREESFGFSVGVVDERLNVVVAHVAAEAQLRGELEILSYAIEQRAGELLVDAHEVSAYTQHVVCRAVAEAHGEVQFR